MIRLYEDMKAYYAPGVISDALDSEIRRWIAHRAEINKPIEESGMSSLLANTTDAAQQYGENAVIDLIETSIVSGWQGLFFERLKTQNPRGRPPGKRDDAPRSQTYDFNSLEQMLNEPKAAGG